VNEINIGFKKYYYVGSDAADNETGAQLKWLISDKDIDYMVDLYDGEIRLVDEKVGTLLEFLDGQGLLNNTMVIILSEHGDIMGKHGRFMRGGPLRGTFYDDVLHVPLILYNPRISAQDIHKDQLVELIDVAPTILDSLSFQIPSSFSGMSMKPILVNNSIIREEIFAASRFYPIGNSRFYNHATFVGTVRTTEWKLIHEIIMDKRFSFNNTITGNYSKTVKNTLESSYELYDLKEDPEELHNVADEEQDILHNMTSQFYKWVDLTENGRS
jgi:arylsulfatase A-like enzyme